MKIYHNPRCSKSRQTLSIIHDSGENVEVIQYLKDIPSEQDLLELLYKLGLKAEELVRKVEPIFKAEYKGKILSEQEWIKAMVDHPKLIERPIVVKGNKAIIGRPPQNVLILL